MQPIAFCSRCRGMEVGWNKRYALHCLICRELVYKSFKSFVLVVASWLFIVAFPISTNIGFAKQTQPEQSAAPVQAGVANRTTTMPSAVKALESMLADYDVDRALRGRVAKAIVASSVKYDVDPRLIASILLVESRANPFAISGSEAIGLMQIHVPTWGAVAEEQGINLFKVEDNIDLGVQILKGYVSRFGLWDGVAHYSGVMPDGNDGSAEYVRKVQHIYKLAPSVKTAPLAASAALR